MSSSVCSTSAALWQGISDYFLFHVTMSNWHVSELRYMSWAAAGVMTSKLLCVMMRYMSWATVLVLQQLICQHVMVKYMLWAAVGVRCQDWQVSQAQPLLLTSNTQLRLLQIQPQPSLLGRHRLGHSLIAAPHQPSQQQPRAHSLSGQWQQSSERGPGSGN